MTAEARAPYRVQSPIVELTKARIRELVREPEAVFWVFIFPIILAAILGLAFRSRPPEALPVAVVEGPQAEGSGSGFGYGFGARPAGAYVIREGKVSWQPAVDVNRLMLGFQVVAVVALLTVRAIVKARARGTPRARGRRS